MADKIIWIIGATIIAIVAIVTVGRFLMLLPLLIGTFAVGFVLSLIIDRFWR